MGDLARDDRISLDQRRLCGSTMTICFFPGGMGTAHHGIRSCSRRSATSCRTCPGAAPVVEIREPRIETVDLDGRAFEEVDQVLAAEYEEKVSCTKHPLTAPYVPNCTIPARRSSSSGFTSTPLGT